MATKKKKKSRQISPPYPYIGLKEAISLLNALHDASGQDEVSKNIAYNYMSLDSSKPISHRYYSALTGFGLVAERQTGNDKKVSVTNLGRRILVARGEKSPIKLGALRTAAMNYEVIRQLSQRWPEGLPDEDDTILNTLMIELHFAERAARTFVPALRETYDFAMFGGYDILDKEKRSHSEKDSNEQEMAKKMNDVLPAGFQEFRMSFAEDKEVRFLSSGRLTQEEMQFVLEWIKRLNILEKSPAPSPIKYQMEDDENEEEYEIVSEEDDLPF